MGLRSTERLAGIFVKRDGHKYLQLNSFDLSIAMDDFKFYATGIFPKPELSKSCQMTYVTLILYQLFLQKCTDQLANTFVNQYWPFVYQQILANTKSVWEPMLIKESNDFLSTLPFEKMLFYGEPKET